MDLNRWAKHSESGRSGELCGMFFYLYGSAVVLLKRFTSHFLLLCTPPSSFEPPSPFRYSTICALRESEHGENGKGTFSGVCPYHVLVCNGFKWYCAFTSIFLLQK